MDTIVYKLHNVHRYPIVVKSVQDLEGGKGKLKVPDVPEVTTAKTFRDAWFNLQRDSWFIMQYNVKAELPSFASGININYDKQQDIIKFEFSIPKFFFANNVVEVIPSMHSKYRDASKTAMWDLAKFWYKIIRLMPRKIVHDLTGGKEALNLRDVQVSRLDICFNQIFDNDADAHHYFDALTRVKAPRLSDGSHSEYKDETFSVLSKRYYFKIYKKGVEFDKNGYNQITKQFEDYLKKGLLYDNCPIDMSFKSLKNLQSYAHRILRYEFEAKEPFLAYAFCTRLKKKHIPQYRELVRMVNYVMRDENVPLLKNVKVRYRDDSGKLHYKKPELLLCEVEYYLPYQYFDADDDRIGEQQVFKPSLVKRIANILQCQTSLKRKYFIMNYRQLKSVHKLLIKEESKAHDFFLECDELNAEKAILKPADHHDVHYDVDAMTLLQETPQAQKFSIGLLYECILKHNSLFNKFQMENLPDSKTIELLAEEYNGAFGRKGGKVNKNQLKLILQNLKHHSWDELRKMGHWDRSTLYRWQKKLEKVLGYGKDINFTTGINLINVSRHLPTLYFRHYNEMLSVNSPLSLFLQNTQLLLSI